MTLCYYSYLIFLCCNSNNCFLCFLVVMFILDSDDFNVLYSCAKSIYQYKQKYVRIKSILNKAHHSLEIQS